MKAKPKQLAAQVIVSNGGIVLAAAKAAAGHGVEMGGPVHGGEGHPRRGRIVFR